MACFWWQGPQNRRGATGLSAGWVWGLEDPHHLQMAPAALPPSLLLFGTSRHLPYHTASAKKKSALQVEFSKAVQCLWKHLPTRLEGDLCSPAAARYHTLPFSKHFTAASSWGQEQQTLTFLVTTVPTVQISNLADTIILSRFYLTSYHFAPLSILYVLSSVSHFSSLPAWDAAGCSWSLVVLRTLNHSIPDTGKLFFKLKINKAMSKAEQFWNSHFASKAVLTVLE